MNKEEIIKYCLTLENTYKDCPFQDDFESVTMKHCKNKNMNKEHWNTIIVGAKVDKTLVKELIEQSYQLTK